MRTSLVAFAVLLCFVVQASSQEIVRNLKAEPVLEGFIPTTNPEWGNDVVVAPSEPLGKPSGAGRANGTGFIAVPDTALQAGRAMVIYRTTNFGDSWTAFRTITPAIPIQKTKMVRLANDSVYCFFQTGGTLYYWNIETSTLRAYDSTNIRDFDVVASNAGGLYMISYAQGTTRIYRAASGDGGVTWGQRATVTSAGAFPRMYLNSTANDTITFTYYGPVKPDTLRSVIRLARYRETAPGTLASVSFADIETDTSVIHSEHAAIKLGNVAWFFSTKGSTGAIDIQCRVSTDGGVTFGAPFLAAGNPNIDEYWFEIANYSAFGGGLDFIYYADSLGGTVNNNTDKMMYGFLTKANPSSVGGRERLSEHSPGWSPRLYVPSNFEYYDPNGESGAIWVGLDGAQRKVYYDRYNATPTSVDQTSGVPEVYTLKQNYPNPFNPSTTIEFAIPKNEFVTLKVFDLLGREVQSLVAENLTAGSYKATVNGERLASGVYIYQLRAGNFVESKKLTLLK